MPKRKKGNIKIELEDENGDPETFKFRPLGLTGVFAIIREELDIDPDDLEGGEDQFTNMTGMYADKIFSSAMSRCLSHNIVDRDELDEKLKDPDVSDEEKEKIRKRIEEADYFISDFTLEEQADILDELMGTEDIQEGVKEAENFPGD